MHVVIAGGGHMGSHLVARLAAEGHEAVVIDVDPGATERIFAELGVVVFTGSATDISVLDQAGIRRADVAVAMTGRDSDNLSFCLLARYYGVPRVLARMLDPKYEVPYRLVGASSVHNEAEILVRSFLNSIDFPEVASLMPIGRGDLVAVEVTVPPAAQVAGLSVAEIARREDFPRGCVFIGVESAAGGVEVPTGATVVQGGSRLIAAAHRPDLRALVGCLTGRRDSAASAEAEELVQALSLVRFLSGMSQEDLHDLAAGARMERRKTGESLFQAGEKGDRIYILRRGEVELEKPGGRRLTLRPPAHFGELAALTGDPHADTARVRQAAELVALDNGAFRSVLLRNPFLALEMANALTASEPPPHSGA